VISLRALQSMQKTKRNKPMCGIVAYSGSHECAQLLINGLRKLEYRGYDSAGLAVVGETQLSLTRAVGKLANLDSAVAKAPPRGSTGIGHTRWATHGKPNEVNAHPHVVGDVAVVHNGIIENYVELKAALRNAGVTFASDTDTEILAHLIDRAWKDGASSLTEAVRAALKQVRGAYAIAVVSNRAPNQIVVAKYDSPLVIGAANGASFAASDIPAILAHTNLVTILEDGEIATMTHGENLVEKLDGTPVARAPKRIEWSATQAEKGGYKHFMLKEIFEQPRALEDTLRGRIDLENARVVADEIGVPVDLAKRIGRVYFVACGTSSHAAMTARYWVEQLARVPATVEIGSEVRNRDPVFLPTDLVVAVSQSGETLDTLAAVKTAKAQGATVLALANVVDSAIPRIANGALYTHAGPEIGVASTKCFTTQLAALLLLAVHLGRERGTLSENITRELLTAALKAPGQMREVLECSDSVRAIAKRHLRSRDTLFLGRGPQFPIALEGALKLKEISYIHAEGYAAGEMKHGPIALIDEEMPVVVVCPKDSHYEKTFSNLQEAKAREGQIIAVCTRGDTHVSGAGVTEIIEIPEARDEVLPMLTVVPLQLLAYHMADLKGTDVDQPRNLAKTVTVE
jgi:glutamine---fructose-6-phosphate transaminase (isomerizing)